MKTKACAILFRRSSVWSRVPSAASSPVRAPPRHLAHSAWGESILQWLHEFSWSWVIGANPHSHMGFVTALSCVQPEWENHSSGRDHWGKPAPGVWAALHTPCVPAPWPGCITAFYAQDPFPYPPLKSTLFFSLTGYCGKVTYVWKHVQSLPSPELHGLFFWYRWCSESQWISEHCWCPL